MVHAIDAVGQERSMGTLVTNAVALVGFIGGIITVEGRMNRKSYFKGTYIIRKRKEAKAR